MSTSETTAPTARIKAHSDGSAFDAILDHADGTSEYLGTYRTERGAKIAAGRIRSNIIKAR